MSEGWIKLHRRLLQNPIASRLELVGAWAWLLLTAAHKQKEFFIGAEKVRLNPGDVVVGKYALSHAWRVSPSKAYRILKLFESELLIKRLPNTKFTVITVLKWSAYQRRETESEPPMDSKKTTAEQPMDTNKKGKKDKKMIERSKIFLDFFKWVSAMPDKIKNPEAYAEKVISKHGEELVGRALRSEGVTSLRKFASTLHVLSVQGAKRQRAKEREEQTHAAVTAAEAAHAAKQHAQNEFVDGWITAHAAAYKKLLACERAKLMREHPSLKSLSEKAFEAMVKNAARLAIAKKRD